MSAETAPKIPIAEYLKDDHNWETFLDATSKTVENIIGTDGPVFVFTMRKLTLPNVNGINRETVYNTFIDIINHNVTAQKRKWEDEHEQRPILEP